jgi:DnaK suppressor protein
MTGTSLDLFQSILETKYRELSGSPDHRDQIAIEHAPDPLDQCQLMGEREMVIRNPDRNAAVLHEIRRAAGRIAEGTYGVCLRCEDEIAPKRISAVPWAAFCIKCQEHVDRQKATGGSEVAENYDRAA